MKSLAILAISLAGPLLAEDGTEPLHFYTPGQALTEASSLVPRDIGSEFLRSRRTDAGIEQRGLDGVYVHKEYRTAHNGVTHLVYRQRFQGLDVENAEWVINIDRDGRVLNAGGRLFDAPDGNVRIPLPESAMKAVRMAVSAVDAKAGERFQPFQKSLASTGRSMTFHGASTGGDIPASMVWRGVRGRVVPAWRFRVMESDGATIHDVVTDGEGRAVMAKRALTLQQNPGRPQGLVYEVNPIVNPRPGLPREGEVKYVPRKLVSFTGDAVASPKGWITGIETAGNNTVTGLNAVGFQCVLGPENCPVRPRTAVSPTLDFSFPLEVGPGAPHPTTFWEAASANLFYLVNRSHDLFHAIGFDEAAGNFQAENYTKEGAGGDAVYAYAQAASGRGGSAALNNASFGSLENDGSLAYMNMYINTGLTGQQAGFFTDGSLDAEVVFHEYTHGVSTRLARRLYTTFQGGSMGEALSDFFAVEFVVPEGAPADGYYPTSEWFLFTPGRGDRTRPYSTNLETNPLTFANLGRVIGFPEVHADGEIFVEALWEVRANLIKQFGEREGRRRVRLLVMDGMKMAVPAASMLDMRDAILLADQTDFRGESQAQIWAGFAKRGMGALAQSGSGDSVHISPSFAVASNQASLRFYEQQYVVGEVVRIVLQDTNNTRQSATVTLRTTSGDRESVTLRRRGPVFLGSITTLLNAPWTGDGQLELIPDDTITATYNDENTGSGTGTAEVGAETSYVYVGQLLQPTALRFPNEVPLGLRTILNAAPVTLPFDFPFFEGKYRSMWVYSDGMISFGRQRPDTCIDYSTLSRAPAIAPLWTDMVTLGGAQPNEDVYLSRGTESVTVRWAGETAPFSPFQAPDPLNFAVTLFVDGRIQFQYGSGNKNLTNSGTFTGCSTGAPVVGLSNGHETFFQLGLHDGAGNLENAPTILWHPPFRNAGGSDGIVESPAVGEAVDGVINVQGIVMESELSLGNPRIDIIIDGRAISTAATGIARPDYCRTNPSPRCPGVGFRRVLDPTLLNIAPGAHRLQIRATNWRGTSTMFPPEPVEFTLSGKPARLPEGAIESPAAGESISGTFTVRGYAYAPDLLVSAVDILIDNVTYGRAQYNIRRTDICTTAVGANCPGVGFQFNLNTRTGPVLLANGTHTIRARVLDEAGRFAFVGEPVSFVVNNENIDPPNGVLVSPRQNETLSGMVRITGHAWDPATAGRVTNVVLILDNAVAYTLRYGTPRPDECAALTNVAACPNIGFELDFDTRLLANGLHLFQIRATNDRGKVTVFPLDSPYGINVFVKNE